MSDNRTMLIIVSIMDDDKSFVIRKDAIIDEQVSTKKVCDDIVEALNYIEQEN